MIEIRRKISVASDASEAYTSPYDDTVPETLAETQALETANGDTLTEPRAETHDPNPVHQPRKTRIQRPLYLDWYLNQLHI